MRNRCMEKGDRELNYPPHYTTLHNKAATSRGRGERRGEGKTLKSNTKSGNNNKQQHAAAYKKNGPKKQKKKQKKHNKSERGREGEKNW